jgi:tetratricopeptide (TPR) repeat protein
MAARAARHGARVVVVLIAGVGLFLVLLVATGVPVAQIKGTACGTLGAVVALDRVVPACIPPARANRALAAGRTAAQRRAFQEALGHYRAAVVDAPGLRPAHIARGDMAHTLGEYEEALSAFQQAAAIAPSADTAVGIAAAAERLGRLDVAVQALESASARWRQQAGAAARAAATNFLACAPANWKNPAQLWQTCFGSRDAYAYSVDASRELVPRWVFRLLIEDGQRDRALAFARDRGWVRDGVDYCAQHTVPIDAETSALLAMLTQPERADCAVETATNIADEGGARLARLILLDRIANAKDAATREHAEHIMRHRLPDHDVPRVAEGLNAAGWRLQHVHDASDEALVVYQKAIDADARFPWPYHNIARLYMGRADYEQARAWLERALVAAPEYWPALYSYAVTNANLKRWPDALVAYRRAATITPDDARLHANIGWTLVELGRQAEAERELQLSVRLDPSLHAERAYLNSRSGFDPRIATPPASSR